MNSELILIATKSPNRLARAPSAAATLFGRLTFRLLERLHPRSESIPAKGKLVKHQRIALLGAALIGAAALYALIPADKAPIVTAANADAPDTARGAEIYAESCAACHGRALQGQPNWRSRGPDGRLPAPPHNATGHTWHHSDRVLFEVTKLGTEAYVGGDYRSNMPGFGGVYSDDEIRDVLAWIKTKWPADIRAAQAKRTAQDAATR